MKRIRPAAISKALGLGIVLLTGAALSGCTHWGGSHGGHPYSWGGGYGGCQLDYSQSTDGANYKTPGLDQAEVYHTEVSDESTRGNARVDSAGNDWVVIGSGSTDVSTTAGDAGDDG